MQWPCFYGIDFASRAELIANGAGVEEICASIGADSLAYISEDGMIDATAAAARAPVHRLLHRRLPHRAARRSDRLGKNLLEARVARHPLPVRPAPTAAIPATRTASSRPS